MPVPAKAQHMSEVEFLAFERESDLKHQFFEGEVFAMSGGTPAHSRIASNFMITLGNRLWGKACQPYNSDLRIKVALTGLITYPGLSVICGPLEFAAGTNDTVVNPTLLVEVLSDSTEAFDRGRKFHHYQRIPSLREYVLVSQHEPRMEQVVRGAAGEWTWREAEGMEASLALPSVDVTLALTDVFAQVEFTPPPEPHSRP
ncbi:MAG: Uma2 family endonuclease [Verrucomicrobiales bacterium]|nr:Uma2 family endonuclease [Verrucomicrobiales bacterium]